MHTWPMHLLQWSGFGGSGGDRGDGGTERKSGFDVGGDERERMRVYRKRGMENGDGVGDEREKERV